MAEHGPLGTPRSAGSVQNGGHFRRRHVRHRRRVNVTLPCQFGQQRAFTTDAHTPYPDSRPLPADQSGEGGFLLRNADQQLRCGVFQKAGHLGHRIRRIEWYVDRAGAQAAQVQTHRFHRLAGLHQHPVSLAHSQHAE